MRKNDEMLSLAELKARLRRFCEKRRIEAFGDLRLRSLRGSWTWQ
jgi:hypothetical protein